jgi:hypothetical protein
VLRQAIEELWKRACMTKDDPKRIGLPERCDKDWFCKAFCAGQGAERSLANRQWKAGRLTDWQWGAQFVELPSFFA